MSPALLPAQDAAKVSEPPPARYEVKASHTKTIPDRSGRRLTIQRVKPLVLPPAPAAPAPAAMDPVMLEAKRAAWARSAHKERRLVFLTGIKYPGGQTLLQWFAPGADGSWQPYEAWSLTDFRSAGLVREFEVGNTIYSLWPIILPAAKREEQKSPPGPLYFPEGTPGFRLVKGDPASTKAVEPIAALHEIYRQEGPSLTAQWLAHKSEAKTREANLKANPPPVQDIVIQVYPFRSNLFPEANADFTAAKSAGEAQALPSR